MSRQRIMVTGGLGFVGSWLVRKLVQQDAGDVIVLDDQSLGVPENLGPAAERVTIAAIDICDKEAVTRAIGELAPQVVIHLAALHFIPACDADPKRCIDVNVGGTQSVLDGCLLAPVEAVVLASTAAVYSPDLHAHDDQAAVGPIDIYGLSKLWSEQLGELFHRKSEVPVGVARLFNVFGPGETNPHLIPAVIRQAQNGEELHLGNLSTKRDYIFVDDVAEGLIALAAAVPEHGMLSCNLGREQAVDGFELVATVGELLDRELRVLTDPARMRASDRPVLLSDCARAHALLGWRAQSTLREGLAAAIAQPTAAGVDVD
jgi:UDP-glucose 4-epimerase